MKLLLMGFYKKISFFLVCFECFGKGYNFAIRYEDKLS